MTVLFRGARSVLCLNYSKYLARLRWHTEKWGEKGAGKVGESTKKKRHSSSARRENFGALAHFRGCLSSRRRRRRRISFSLRSLVGSSLFPRSIYSSSIIMLVGVSLLFHRFAGWLFSSTMEKRFLFFFVSSCSNENLKFFLHRSLLLSCI